MPYVIDMITLYKLIFWGLVIVSVFSSLILFCLGRLIDLSKQIKLLLYESAIQRDQVSKDLRLHE